MDGWMRAIGTIDGHRSKKGGMTNEWRNDGTNAVGGAVYGKDAPIQPKGLENKIWAIVS